MEAVGLSEVGDVVLNTLMAQMDAESSNKDKMRSIKYDPVMNPENPSTTTCLSGWTSSFTERLFGTRAEKSRVTFEEDVVVLDDAMSQEQSLGSRTNFCSALLEELKESKLLDKLKPAKTTGERQSDALMDLLAKQGIVDSMQEPSLYQQSSVTNKSNIRGDNSIFVSREYRQGPNQHEFQTRHPLLHALIATISATIQQQVESHNQKPESTNATFCLDWNKTSVQVATYPGDGTSGYPRHCDRGQDSCKFEKSKNVQQETSASPSQRLLTAIYYLVEDDWDADLDGGALRVFHDGDEDGDFTDIVPRQNRLVVFRSDCVEHQVLPSLRRSRTAITIWFYGTVKIESKMDSIATNGPFIDLPPPLPILSSDVACRVSTIFVSMASYRDSETRPTLDAMFATANHPNRIYCGIVMQLKDGESYDEGIWHQVESFPRPQQIRYLRLHARDAMGPCYARGLAQTLWRGEDYVLQIDAHMRFRPNWDVYLIQQCQKMIEQIRSDKVMLTTYPLGYTLPNNIPKNETRGTYLVPWKFDDQGMLRQCGRVVKRNDKSFLPHKHYLYAGGFNFAPSRVIRDVPYDTMGLPHLFFGEELSMAIRLFTHGYELYAPMETVCYHLWSRGHRPTTSPTQDTPVQLQQRSTSQKRVMQQLLGESSVVGVPMGLGNDGTAAAFAERLKVDFANKILLQGCENGELKDADFALGATTASPLYQESVEAKIAALDSKAKALVASFLSGISY
ncbi:glycosyltransferase GlcNAc [Nitzschia inconspicua]|uniref:Glycosyltransferase GlcNAc n=1 Tax=Nitzschia inconspicua TaxID=303405 RepID=A0A9K3M3R7_9STRA|nr:glycosyltransferase GlcNAc [Nitzschia inconspicua]